MKEIELIIKIPEEIRLALINNVQLSLDQQSICDSCIKQAIINGIPVQKEPGKADTEETDLVRQELPERGHSEIQKGPSVIYYDKRNYSVIVVYPGKE